MSTLNGVRGLIPKPLSTYEMGLLSNEIKTILNKICTKE